MSALTRRRLLGIAGTTAVGALAAGAGLALRPSEEAAATLPGAHAGHHGHHGPGGWEVVRRATHRGRRIEVLTNGKGWRCRVDGKPLHPHVFDRQRDGSFSSHLLPYADPPDPVELVRALLDGEALELFRLG